MEPGCVAGRTSLPHCQPKYCETCSRTRGGLERGAERAAKKPTIDEREPELAEREDDGQRHLREVVDGDPGGQEHERAPRHEASDSKPPSGKPRKTLARFSRDPCESSCSSTAPDEKKNTSYGVIAAPKSAMA